MAAANSTTIATPTPSVITSTTETGTTVIADSVIAKVAGIAARDVPGVFALGGGAARAIGAIRDAINSTDLAQGISVEVGETQVAVDITIVALYPTPLQTVADNVRAAVYTAIEDLVGMQVTEVNISITDVHIPSVDDTTDATSEVKEARVL
ncbi:Asp23/Gls24 family envelope stress response protein [Glaciihabitans sp. dw_435]|uniref:Asp23/Gls24 family envelope stress response protein n=1 Tax=Glaciihabitans sp. dw_435 TaxID=2720081 RepID=UPI001BD35B55|nr:Asp23/Gls24 family envelope stress response protein [Glaciihabitans sp. dw_435]